MKPAPTAGPAKARKPPGLKPKPHWLGRLLRVSLLLLLLLIGTALALPFALPWLLQQQGIDFDWQNPRWHYDGFSVSSLQLNRPRADGQSQSLQVDNLHIDWAWQSFSIQRLHASRLQAQWPLVDNNVAANNAQPSIPDTLLRWLPKHIALNQVDAELEGLGHLQGNLNLQASAKGGLWQPHFIQTQLTLGNLQGAWLNNIPKEFRPNSLSAHISTHPEHQNTANGQQLLTIALHSKGPAGIELNGVLELQQKPEWQGALKNAQLLIQLDTLAQPSVSAQQLQLRAYFEAHANSERFTVNLTQESTLEANTIILPDIGSAEKAGIRWTDLTLEGQSTNPFDIKVSSPLTAHIEGLNIDQLYKQNWDFKGNLSGQLAQLELAGDLTGQQGLSLRSSVRMLENAIQGSATTTTIFFKAGNPLQKTFKTWPKLISLDNGRLSSQINFNLPANGPFHLTINGNASGLSGIIDRSELKNLNLKFSGQLSEQTLTLGVSHLNVEQLDPGIPIEQIQVKGAHYQANINNLLQGIAEWKRIEARLLNGKVWLDTHQLDLHRSQALTLQVQGLELEELLKVYPAEGLDGTGTIDGLLPINIENNSLSIEEGHLTAREPGVLQFRSAKIQALGQSNPAMSLVADALEDFHFSLLSSTLSYGQSGKLLLNVALEGQNPNVEKGRRINLNVNLEEDIPALLASIQLSGQVSEMIQKRIRESFEKR